MDHISTYQSGRRFLPYGWATSSAPCCGPCMGQGRPRANPPIEFRACPVYQPLPRKYGHPSGMNTSVGPEPIKNEYDNDPCRGRRWNPPCPASGSSGLGQCMTPINVELKMVPAPQERGPRVATMGCCDYDYNNTGNACPTPDSMVKECPRRRPNGNKAERTCPIIPKGSFDRSTGPVNLKTTYQTEFFPKPLVKVASLRPQRIVSGSKGDFPVNSLYRSDYCWHTTEPFKQAHWARDTMTKISSMPMNLLSSYKLEYQRKDGRPAESMKRKSYFDPNRPPLDDRSTYQIDFVPLVIPCKEEKMTNTEIINEIVAEIGPFEGMSIYKRDYQPVKGSRQAIYTQVKTPQPYGGVMEDKTTYRCAYEPYYFDEGDCIPADLYDNMYPRDKCADVRVCPEPERIVRPSLGPSPPCPEQGEESYCPTPYEMRCAPRVVPCLSPYKMEVEKDCLYDTTTITLKNNTNGDMQDCKPAVVEC